MQLCVLGHFIIGLHGGRVNSAENASSDPHPVPPSMAMAVDADAAAEGEPP